MPLPHPAEPTPPVIIGVDFGAPRRARDQRRKIIALSAQPTGPHTYCIGTGGMNARLLASDLPGWSAEELITELLVHPARVVGFDFPFCVPYALLRDPKFASDVGHHAGEFVDWRSFSSWVARRLPLAEPLDFSPFDAWRRREDRARLWAKRATDVAAGAQPPLKDRFQATFQMTLLGNALLSRLWESGKYRVRPFPGGNGGDIIEVYPRATLRSMGLTGYKSHPEESIRLGRAACATAGITLEVAPRLLALAHRYSSGTAAAPDYDVADAFVALCTAILHAERGCQAAFVSNPSLPDRLLMQREGVIWVPKLSANRPSNAPARHRA